MQSLNPLEIIIARFEALAGIAESPAAKSDPVSLLNRIIQDADHYREALGDSKVEVAIAEQFGRIRLRAKAGIIGRRNERRLEALRDIKEMATEVIEELIPACVSVRVRQMPHHRK